MAPMDCSDGCVPPMLSTIVSVQKEILWLLQDGNEAPSRGERRRQEQTRVWHGPNSTLLQKRREQTRVWQHFTSGQINLYHIGRMLTWNYIYVGVDTWYVGVDTWSRGFVLSWDRDDAQFSIYDYKLASHFFRPLVDIVGHISKLLHQNGEKNSQLFWYQRRRGRQGLR